MTRHLPRFGPDELRDRLGPVLARYADVAVAYVFGSVARGDAGSESDLDVGLVYRQRGSDAHDRVAAELSAHLARAVDWDDVDLVDLEAQGPIFAHRVLCEGHRVYVADPDRRVDFESDTYVRAFDFRPTYELATRGKPAALRRWLRIRYDL